VDRLATSAPIRYGRTSTTAFAHLRGSAAVIAGELGADPTSGWNVQLCGDAHVTNFGLFSSPDRRLVFDINDFGEALPGPFEWDAKRLATSVMVLGEVRGFSKKRRRMAAESVARSYRLATSQRRTTGFEWTSIEVAFLLRSSHEVCCFSRAAQPHTVPFGKSRGGRRDHDHREREARRTTVPTRTTPTLDPPSNVHRFTHRRPSRPRPSARVAAVGPRFDRRSSTVTDRAVADTSIFVASETGRPLDTSVFPEEIAVSVVTIGELRAGVLAATDLATRDLRLRTLATALQMEPIPIDVRVAESWALLRVTLRDAGMRMPLNDSWIAATAMSLGVPVITQDNNFPQLPGLTVIHA